MSGNNKTDRDTSNLTALPEMEYAKTDDPDNTEDSGPYAPEDGAAIRFSSFRLYKGDHCFGGGIDKGHIGRDQFINSPFIVGCFESALSLLEIRLAVTHYTYGLCSSIRDVSDDELRLVASGAFRDAATLNDNITVTIRREDVILPPVSPLTERGMSLFFTKAAEIAEIAGLAVDGVIDGWLQISIDGEPVIRLDESGSGCYALFWGGRRQEIDFPIGPHDFKESAIGIVTSPSDVLYDVLESMKIARSEIKEVLHPNDYALMLSGDEKQSVLAKIRGSVLATKKPRADKSNKNRTDPER